MQRRDFCRLLAIAAAARAIPASSQMAPENSSDLPAEFNEYTQDYARFCALPPNKRTFYKLSNGKIVQEKLDNAPWKATAWGGQEPLPVPGDSWDGVPTESPIADLAGRGPFKPTWDSLLQYDGPEWYQDAKFGIWAHWSPQCVPEDGDWYARNMYSKDSASINISSTTTVRPPGSAIKTSARNGLCPRIRGLRGPSDGTQDARYLRTGIQSVLVTGPRTEPRMTLSGHTHLDSAAATPPSAIGRRLHLEAGLVFRGE